MLILESDEAACAEVYGRVAEDHQAALDGFEFLEPLTARARRKVVDPRWAALADGLDVDHRVVCSGLYGPDEFVRPIAREQGAAVWVGTLVAREPQDDAEMIGAIAVASSQDEFETAAADYVERMGLQVVEWQESREAVGDAEAPEVLDRFGDSQVYTSSTWPMSNGSGIWRGLVDIAFRDPSVADGAAGAVFNALASASTEDDFRQVVATWMDRWEMDLLGCEDVEQVANETEVVGLAEWMKDHFGFFHDSFRYWTEDEDVRAPS